MNGSAGFRRAAWIPTARWRAPASCSGTSYTQSAVLAFREGYLLIFAVFLLLLPLVPLLRRPEA